MWLQKTKTANKVNNRVKMKALDLRGLVLFGVLIIMVIIFSILAPNFFTINNFLNLGMYSAVMAIAAVGMTFVIICGSIDISVGAIMSCCGVLTAYSLAFTQRILFSVSCGLLLGILLGIANGVLVTKLKVNSIIVTIGTMSVLKGSVFLITQGRLVSFGRLESFSYLGPKRLGGIFPMAFLIMVFVYIVGGLILSKLRFGRHVYATGGNIVSSRLAGIKVDLVQITVFAISGISAGLSGIILTSMLASGYAQIGIGKEIDIIAATVLGGASINGGRGNLFGTFIGVMIIEIVGNAFTQLNLITFWHDIFKGCILIIGIYFDQLREMKASK